MPYPLTNPQNPLQQKSKDLFSEEGKTDSLDQRIPGAR